MPGGYLQHRLTAQAASSRASALQGLHNRPLLCFTADPKLLRCPMKKHEILNPRTCSHSNPPNTAGTSFEGVWKCMLRSVVCQHQGTRGLLPQMCTTAEHAQRCSARNPAVNRIVFISRMSVSLVTSYSSASEGLAFCLEEQYHWKWMTAI